MRQALHRFTVETKGQGLVEITGAIRQWLMRVDIREGLLTVYCRHTSASLLIQENADPDVCTDLQTFFSRIAPEGRGLYVHESEGPDDMPAHIRAALTQTQVSIPIDDGELLLGTWQGIYLFEHRRAPHRREIVLHVIGE
jgi:secondary thiamine-phosphate synthase enzyme